MKVRALSIALAALSTLTITTAAPASAATAPTFKQRLANVVVPADCRMPQQRLHNGATAAKFLPAQGAISFGPNAARPMLVHLRPLGTQLIAQYGCTAGGVGWPSVIVLYNWRNQLIASLNLGTLSRSEHAHVDRWRVIGHTVRLEWTSYDGAWSNVKHHYQTLRLYNHALHLQ